MRPHLPHRLISIGRRLRRAAAEERGSVAVEFAGILLPLVILTMGIFDGAMLMFTDSVVSGAANEAAREIRTGALRSALDVGAFRKKVCDGTMKLLDCGKLAIDVRSFPSWSAVIWPVPQIAEDGTVSNFGFSLGGASAITIVRVIYPYQVLTPGLTFAVDHLNRSATVVMRTEPFQ